MPSALVTDWKRIAQSGDTVDGRFIKPEWLTEMAETYDPATYTAKIWIDHMRYASYGSVRALKVEKDGDVIRLFAKISPSRSLLQTNQIWEEKLHFSIEPTEDFAKTGKTYLTGLAMTDQPASLGTDEMRFAQLTGRNFTRRLPGEPVPDLREAFSDENENEENFFKKLKAFFQTEKQDEQGEDPMDKEQFAKLDTGISTLATAMDKVVSAIETFTATPGDGETPPAQDKADANAAPAAGDNEFSEQFTELTGIINGLKDEFSTLKTRLEKANPGTHFTDTSAPAQDQDGIL